MGSHSYSCNPHMDNRQNMVPRNRRRFITEKKKKFIGSDREHSFFDDIKILMLLHLYIFSLLYSVQVEGLVKLLIWPLLSSCFYFKLFHLASFLNFGGFGSLILVSKDNNLASLVLQFSEESFYLGFGV